MLDCQCAGVGLIPHEDLKLKKNHNINEYDTDELSSQRDCQLHIAQPASSSTFVRMNQLFRWQHYSQPIKSAVLQVRVIKSMFHLCLFSYFMELYQLLKSYIITICNTTEICE
jgi:hypothetical protein